MIWISILVLLCSSQRYLYAELLDQPLAISYGKGNAVSAETGSMEYALKNPATAAFLTQREFEVVAASHFGGSFETYYFGYAVPKKEGVWTFHLPVRQVSGLTRTKSVGGQSAETGTFSDTELSLVANYAKKTAIKHLAIGASFAYDSQVIDNANALGLRVGFGALYKKGRWSVAHALENVLSFRQWSTGRSESVPFYIHSGVGVDITRRIRVLTEASWNAKKTIFSLGGELKCSEELSLIVGTYDIQNQSRVTAGVNLKLKRLNITYVMGQHAALDSTHKLGVSFVF